MHIHRKRTPERVEWTASNDSRTLRKLAKGMFSLLLVVLFAFSLKGNETGAMAPFVGPRCVEACCIAPAMAGLQQLIPNAALDAFDGLPSFGGLGTVGPSAVLNWLPIGVINGSGSLERVEILLVRPLRCADGAAGVHFGMRGLQ